MALPTQQNVWILANPPAGPIQADTFALEKRPLRELNDGEVLLSMEYFSNDPAQRGWIQKDADAERTYLPPVRQGDVVRASGIATVLASKSSKWPVGSRVMGRSGWYDVGIEPEDAIMSPAVELPGMPAASLSVLGMVAVTAFQGIFEILKLQKEHTVVISGAAGAVGSIAVQLAKHVVGAKRVVGIAGGKEKCDWVVNHLGADACVDYKAATDNVDLQKRLKEALGGQFADRYYDNVGGDILNAMFRVIARHGKIGVCGMISGYMGAKPDMSNISQIVSNRVTIEGFLVLDMQDKWVGAVQQLAGWIKEGKIKTSEAAEVVDAPIDKVPEVWQRLFRGENRGKLITKLV